MQIKFEKKVPVARKLRQQCLFNYITINKQHVSLTNYNGKGQTTRYNYVK